MKIRKVENSFRTVKQKFERAGAPFPPQQQEIKRIHEKTKHVKQLEAHRSLITTFFQGGSPQSVSCGSINLAMSLPSKTWPNTTCL